MNNRARFNRLIALLILVATAMSMVSCENLPFDIEGIFHSHNFVDGKCECGETDPDYVHEHYFANGECIYCGEKKPEDKPTHEHSYVDGKCECGETDPDYNGATTEYQTITIAEALEIAAANPDGTTELYYINATVKTIKNASYGEMYIEDTTGEIYVYGTRGEDGTTYFDALPERPVKGDKVLLLCQLSQYKGENQVKLARLISFEHVEVDIGDLTAYEEMTIAEAREADADKLVRVKGVVAQITYANGQVPSGVILVDSTSSIYVYSNDLAGQVTIGNTVEIAASKTYFVNGSEASNAEKFGYKGANQLVDAIVISNDKGSADFDKSWITESTVKEIMDTPVTEDITAKIFKVNALVKKAPGNGFTNYYIDDIDGVTGSYVYTQCNGGDFGWLDEFDGKICTVYLVALNAKASTSGCIWRFLPVAVSDDGYTFDTTKAAEYAVKYHGVGQFLNNYTGDPALELLTSVSSELLGLENVVLTYSSSNEDVIHFATADGKTVMHCSKTGTATVTVSSTFSGTTYSETVEITVEAAEEFESIGVKEAIDSANNTVVTVKGIVGPSLVNKVGFYLIDETGVIPVLVAGTEFEGLEIGHRVIVSGTRTITKDGGGQICLEDATILANLYGKNDYSTKSFITDKTIGEICAIADSAEATTSVYVVTVKVERVAGGYSTDTYIKDTENDSISLMLYAGGPGQYEWLESFFAEGESSATLTVEVALCDWNAKGLKGCVLSVIKADGTKVYNEYNFINN